MNLCLSSNMLFFLAKKKRVLSVFVLLTGRCMVKGTL